VDGSYPKSAKYLNNMKQYYEHVLLLLEEQESNKNVSVEVKYNSNLGYPSEIEYKGSGMDQWYRLEISNVQILKE